MLLSFDFDGVVVDSFDSVFETLLETHKELGLGREPRPQDLQTIDSLTPESFTALIGVPEEERPCFIKRAFEIQEQKPIPEPFPGIAEVVLELPTIANPIIVTSSTEKIVSAVLEGTSLETSFRKVLGSESGISKSERIKHELASGFSAHQSLMVGDAISDIRQGKLAGVKTVAVSWGFQAEELLLAERPDFLARSPAELAEIIKEISKL